MEFRNFDKQISATVKIVRTSVYSVILLIE